ncbi:S-adenosylmethionine mitochondrial carrier protein homolog isoform X2 [Cimex lectularius]|uniref:Mitochondrial carrier protein n=1 Tax=Cimex lectularius TaxID=79782 RepID=A0A8I6TB40_CIMLE|nr:S-adenosylmethionine mitochondrial carrier protein homolog isoform X2 [Cimex lectularius]
MKKALEGRDNGIGALAGLTVDISLFPLDTLKTRLQSSAGFWKCGGFRGVYRGVGPTAIGAAPTAALFFASYNGFKKLFEGNKLSDKELFAERMFGAAFAEMVSCIIRVPTEVVKQRRQAFMQETAFKIFSSTFKYEGVTGLYRGFWVTVLRDAPFSIIQYPLWELLKKQLNQDTPAGGALCGAIAGSFAGAVTTPLDVIKTRKMLVQNCDEPKAGTTWFIIQGIYHQRGIRGFFAGFIPRTVWIFLGGFVFFGTYEAALQYLEKL